MRLWTIAGLIPWRTQIVHYSYSLCPALMKYSGIKPWHTTFLITLYIALMKYSRTNLDDMYNWLVISLCFEPSQPQNDYVRDESKLQCISYLSIPQVFVLQVSFFSNHNSNYIYNFGTQTQKNKNTCFGACLYSAGTQHGNLHPAG